MITAALSSCNSGLYATGRILRSMARNGEAPRFTGTLSSRHVPIGGIVFTAAMFLGGVALFYFLPLTSLQHRHRRRLARRGHHLGHAGLLPVAAAPSGHRSSFPMPAPPYTNWLTLAFLALVVLLMPFADADQRVAFFLVPVLIAGIALGWTVLGRKRAASAAQPAQPAADPAE